MYCVFPLPDSSADPLSVHQAALYEAAQRDMSLQRWEEWKGEGGEGEEGGRATVASVTVGIISKISSSFIKGGAFFDM